MWCPYFFMPQGRCSETRLSICSRSKVFPTTSSIDSVFWHMLDPSIVPLGRWESESFLAYCFFSSPCQTGFSPDTPGQFVWSKQELHWRENCKQHNGSWDWPIVCTNVKPSTFFLAPCFPFGWLWAIYFVLFIIQGLYLMMSAKHFWL